MAEKEVMQLFLVLGKIGKTVGELKWLVGFCSLLILAGVTYSQAMTKIEVSSTAAKMALEKASSIETRQAVTEQAISDMRSDVKDLKETSHDILNVLRSGK